MNTVHNTYVVRSDSGRYVWKCSCSAHGMYFLRSAAEIAAAVHEREYGHREEDMKRETVQVYYPKPEVQYEVWSKSSDMRRGGFHGSFDTFERADSEARAVRDRLKRTVRVVKVTG